MVAISVQNLKKDYIVTQKEPGLLGSFKSIVKPHNVAVQAVGDISFEIDTGELVGFIGPNGAGKTTTLKTLSGLLYPTSGKISVLGHQPFERKFEFLRKISLVMGQKQQLWWDLPAIETFRLNKEIYHIEDTLFKKTLDELVELLEVEDILNTQVRKLSLGQRMKCELIAALLHAPKVLYLDEPTIGLDVLMQKKIREFIKEYNTRHKATILLTSHYMKDVQELCKRIIIIDHGKLLFDGKIDDIIKKFAHHKTFILTLEHNKGIQALQQYGSITYRNGSEIHLSVERKNVSSIAADILKKFAVSDLTIEEISMEDIIRNVFSDHATLSPNT